jgi:hypothetical protein
MQHVGTGGTRKDFSAPWAQAHVTTSLAKPGPLALSELPPRPRPGPQRTGQAGDVAAVADADAVGEDDALPADLGQRVVAADATVSGCHGISHQAETLQLSAGTSSRPARWGLRGSPRRPPGRASAARPRRRRLRCEHGSMRQREEAGARPLCKAWRLPLLPRESQGTA